MTIGYFEEQSAITQYLDSQFSGYGILYFIDNEEVGKVSVSEWCNVSVQPFDSKNLSIGTKAYRYWGMLYIQIFTRPSSGSGRNREIADILSNIFRDTTVNMDIRFKVPKLAVVGVIDGWYQSTLSTEFFREEF